MSIKYSDLKLYKYVNNYIQDNNLIIDLIVGYSFGGAVAVDYLSKYKKDSKLFLIAPAIIRNTYNSKKYMDVPKLLLPLKKFLRNIYVTYIIKNNEMYYGTKFLKNTYQNIVRVNEQRDLYNINPNKVCITYGNMDTAVNPQEMINTIRKEYVNKIHIIDKADHDNIITDYVNELEDIIKNF